MAMATRSMPRHTPGTAAGVIQLQTERQPFPVIDAVVNDEAVGSLKGSKFEPIQLAKVEKLLADPHSVSILNSTPCVMHCTIHLFTMQFYDPYVLLVILFDSANQNNKYM